MVDTGAEISILPATQIDKTRTAVRSLQDVNHTTISTYGERSLTLNFGFRRVFRWIFIVADVPTAIIGAVFLNQFSLIVDIGHGKLLDNMTNFTLTGIK